MNEIVKGILEDTTLKGTLAGSTAGGQIAQAIEVAPITSISGGYAAAVFENSLTGGEA